MNDELSPKQRKKKEALIRRQTNKRVKEFRKQLKEDDIKSVQVYLEGKDKEILDKYKSMKGQTTGEVFKELIRSILKRRLKDFYE